MIEIATLAVSSAVAHVATNLDNLIILIGLIATVGRRPAISGYLLAQVAVLAAAFFVAERVDTELPIPVGYLGVIPIVLGLWSLWRGGDDSSTETQSPTVKPQVFALTLLFLSLSFDTFAVFAPLLADSRAAFSAPVLLGAAVSAMALALAGALIGQFAPSRVAQVARLERFAPYVMIAIGLYVVLNTATDAV
ncbi:cadmium resistance transporter [Shimia sp. R10_1]|uniref:cadmium resistance transporter n=1 Tax=Shimia sp. R10_1 TaxID=2821095 RepID=UPI001ADC25A2|nr:cadmium resistance transporter [Shimia sp. R10_1]MBO9473326.1 cadmium resistance transporter [Shimia sp. R10_1]